MAPRGRLIRGRSSVHTRLSGGGLGADLRVDFASRPSRCNATETADGQDEQRCGDVHDDGQPKLTFSTQHSEWAMKRIFCRCSMPIVTFLFLLIAGYAVNANAQVPTPPFKIITIYNNSKNDTIYPVLAGYSGDVDLWLQAQFNVSPSNSFDQTFVITTRFPLALLNVLQGVVQAAFLPHCLGLISIWAKASFRGNLYLSMFHFIRN
jgi:hypothetical protein